MVGQLPMGTERKNGHEYRNCCISGGNCADVNDEPAATRNGHDEPLAPVADVSCFGGGGDGSEAADADDAAADNDRIKNGHPLRTLRIAVFNAMIRSFSSVDDGS